MFFKKNLSIVESILKNTNVHLVSKKCTCTLCGSISFDVIYSLLLVIRCQNIFIIIKLYKRDFKIKLIEK